MQPKGDDLREVPDTALTPHELDQEWLYRAWRDGRVEGKWVRVWANALETLQREAPCEYFNWLMLRCPPLVKDGPCA